MDKDFEDLKTEELWEHGICAIETELMFGIVLPFRGILFKKSIECIEIERGFCINFKKQTVSVVRIITNDARCGRGIAKLTLGPRYEMISELRV